MIKPMHISFYKTNLLKKDHIIKMIIFSRILKRLLAYNNNITKMKICCNFILF